MDFLQVLVWALTFSLMVYLEWRREMYIYIYILTHILYFILIFKKFLLFLSLGFLSSKSNTSQQGCISLGQAQFWRQRGNSLSSWLEIWLISLFSWWFSLDHVLIYLLKMNRVWKKKKLAPSPSTTTPKSFMNVN